MPFEHKEIEQAIHKSQHCQRNWDLSREIPAEDLDLLVTAATQCPSKQNIAFYKVHMVTNRDIIERIHLQTDGFTISYQPPRTTTNTQTLANLLVVFEQVDVSLDTPKDQHRNTQTAHLAKTNLDVNDDEYYYINRDKHVALGVAAGYLNLTASLMGYATGCCSCFDYAAVQSILNLEKLPCLLMGVGFKDPSVSRRIHHINRSFVFPTKVKQPIEVSIIR